MRPLVEVVGVALGHQHQDGAQAPSPDDVARRVEHLALEQLLDLHDVRTLDGVGRVGRGAVARLLGQDALHLRDTRLSASDGEGGSTGTLLLHGVDAGLDVVQELAVLHLDHVLEAVLLDDLGDGHLVRHQLLLHDLELEARDGEEADREPLAVHVLRGRLTTEVHGHRAGTGLDVDDLHHRVVLGAPLQVAANDTLVRNDHVGEAGLAEAVLDVVEGSGSRLRGALGLEALDEARVHHLCRVIHDVLLRTVRDQIQPGWKRMVASLVPCAWVMTPANQLPSPATGALPPLALVAASMTLDETRAWTSRPELSSQIIT